MAEGLFFLLVEISGIALAIWAIIIMKSSKLKISPPPHQDSTLVRKGPYKFIRHPMYLSILIVFTSILISRFSYIGLAIFVSLTLNLLLKLNFEESLLSRHFHDYDSYKTRTWKLIPYIY